MSYTPNKKRPNQNLYDFILTNYGDLSGLRIFLEDKKSTLDFAEANIGTVFETNDIDYNDNKIFMESNNIIVTSGNRVEGDFNDDFSDDFSN